MAGNRASRNHAPTLIDGYFDDYRTAYSSGLGEVWVRRLNPLCRGSLKNASGFANNLGRLRFLLLRWRRGWRLCRTNGTDAAGNTSGHSAGNASGHSARLTSGLADRAADKDRRLR